MKKKIFYVFLSVFSLSILLYCSSDNILEANNESHDKNEIIINLLRESGNLNFTNGGGINLSSNQIIELYRLCSNDEDYNNVKEILIYTEGNESGTQNIDINKLNGISIYKNKNGYLQHSFYKKNNNDFEIVEDLTLNASKVTLQDVNFIIYYSKLLKNRLTVYSSINPLYNNQGVEESNDFSDFMVWDYGSKVNFRGPIKLVEGIEPTEGVGNGKCGACEESVYGKCESLDGSWCDANICQNDRVKNTLVQNNRSIAFFDDNKSYEIRDQFLTKSFIGTKYILYYYNSSFSKMNFSIQESLEFAELIPKIYTAYDKYKNNDIEATLINDEFASEIIISVNKLKSKNQDKKYFVKILDDIIEDVNFIKNKNVGEIKSKIY